MRPATPRAYPDARPAKRRTSPARRQFAKRSSSAANHRESPAAAQMAGKTRQADTPPPAACPRRYKDSTRAGCPAASQTPPDAPAPAQSHPRSRQSSRANRAADHRPASPAGWWWPQKAQRTGLTSSARTMPGRSVPGGEREQAAAPAARRARAASDATPGGKKRYP
ncbi:hypothetical protein Amal_01931 [Acetobacter malorum]|uniref:Uncharacterized protein n=1 Tax=Acetobacter malorum TaxID=178901 RepID=A0A177G793_9PROT|nr:hypothetical protein Amal_01931 [Acetobacter malorum]